MCFSRFMRWVSDKKLACRVYPVGILKIPPKLPNAKYTLHFMLCRVIKCVL